MKLWMEVKYHRASVKSAQQALYCFEMAFKCRADYAELMSLLVHLKKPHQRRLKSPFRSFVLSGACRYTMLEFLLSCLICNEEDPDQLGLQN